MNYKYKLIDESDCFIIGYFDSINGLSDMDESTGEEFSNLSFINFKFDEDFKRKCLSGKYVVSNLYILILDNYGTTLGSYYFVLESPNVLLSADIRDGRSISFNGYLSASLSNETLRIWDHLRGLNKNNKWCQFNRRQREIWLEIIRNSSSAKSLMHQRDESEQTYYLDGRYVTNVISFYFALGESINGPGGYYGGCIDSLLDCLCGSFGAVPPFTLEISGLTNNIKRIENIVKVLVEHNVTIIINN